MDRKKHLSPLRIVSLLALMMTFVLCSCVSPGTQNAGVAAGPDRAEMGKRAEINAELTKVFDPIDEKSELLQSQ